MLDGVGDRGGEFEALLLAGAQARAEMELCTLREEAEASCAGLEGSTVDPRFLAFEFLWNIQLRARQVALVLEC